MGASRVQAVALGSRRVLLERLRVAPAAFRAPVTTVLSYLETWRGFMTCGIRCLIKIS